jgi:hypothetical protein
MWYNIVVDVEIFSTLRPYDTDMNIDRVVIVPLINQGHGIGSTNNQTGNSLLDGRAMLEPGEIISEV